ncbi:hypothetical protein QOM21_26310 [Streptomyces sp. Pv4-95]|uniref:DUF6891 domain-containing protein n=1 Tax=Streptomyces sp. Pv4-95 TaxID=3049543 RepID=UPI0038923859
MLAITVKTETGPVLARPAEGELVGLLGRIGGDDDHFVVVERDPEEDHFFLQTWREGPGPFTVEFRDGAPDRHFTAESTDTGQVVEVFLAWARGTDSWRTALDWQPADLVSTPGLDPEIRAAAEERARKDIRSGFWGFRDIAQGVVDTCDPEESPVSPDQARRIVAGLWEERLAEQAGWPEVTEPDLVARAFAVLDGQGVTARMNFSCCASCGLAEIGAERAEADHGFAFFHYQDTEAAAAGHGLAVRFGAYPDSGRDRAEIGRTVTAALAGAGLPVQWDGDPGQVVRVTPLEWLKRLPTGA